MSDTNRRHKKTSGRLAAILLAAGSIIIALLLLINRQFIIDQMAVWQYQPSGEIKGFAERSGMSEKGAFVFYASKPSLESTQEFNDKCTRKEESAAILGCYTGMNIYIYNVPNEALDGIREVTAAHEMLHAAYIRLGDNERKKIDALLEAEYAKLKDDPSLAERMAFYARTEPGERDNELHSVIGTEVEKISSELETHYKTYFANRSKVTALHTKYATVFSDLDSKGKQLSDALTKLGDEIEQDSATYNKDVSQLNADIQAFNIRAKNGDFEGNAAFQSARSTLLSRAAALNARRDAVNNLVTRYNAMREELLGISTQSDALNRSIDSTLAPAPSV